MLARNSHLKTFATTLAFIIFSKYAMPTAYANDPNLNYVGKYYQTLDITPNGIFREALSGLISQHDYLSNKNIWSYLEASHQSATDSESVQLFYTRRVTSKSNKASGSNQANNDYWNREHAGHSHLA